MSMFAIMRACNEKQKLKFKPLPDYGDHMTKEKFISAVGDGLFINYDGYATLATSTKNSNRYIFPSEVSGFKWPKWCTHVVWYNR